jgi:ryanodine receptor 2
VTRHVAYFQHYLKVAQNAGLKALRIGLAKDGRVLLSPDGRVVGYDDRFRADVRKLLDLAAAHDIRVEFTLVDFLIAGKAEVGHEAAAGGADEQQGAQMSYRPRPIDTSAVELSIDLLDLRERLAENTHDVWASRRLAEGWMYGPTRDDLAKKHPDLVPYAELPDTEKQYDRATAMETLKAIIALGYRIERA